MFSIGYAASQEVILKGNDGVQTIFNIGESSNLLLIDFKGKRYQYKDVIGIEGQVYK